MSTRRVELVQGGSGSWRASRCLEALVLREVGGAQQLEQAEEAVDVVVQRYRGEQQHVPPQGRDRRHGAPGRVAGMARRTAQAVGLVDDQQVDPGQDGLLA